MFKKEKYMYLFSAVTRRVRMSPWAPEEDKTMKICTGSTCPVCTAAAAATAARPPFLLQPTQSATPLSQSTCELPQLTLKREKKRAVRARQKLQMMCVQGSIRFVLSTQMSVPTSPERSTGPVNRTSSEKSLLGKRRQGERAGSLNTGKERFYIFSP